MKRMKKAGLVATSMATIAVCSSLIVGSTYALFTSEDNVNIAVTAGKVSVTATVDKDSLALTSMGIAQDGNNWANGGSAVFSDKKNLDLTNITPGDSATFDIKVTNESNVNIQYRLNWSVDGELAGALEATATCAKIGYWTEWLASDVNEKTVTVTVTLPEEVGNEYQEKSASISFAVEAVQANGVYQYDKTIWDGVSVDTSWYTEADASATTYTLETAAELAGLSELVNGGNTFKGKTVQLGANIDLNNELWTPIGNSDGGYTTFLGIFDGANHAIGNLKSDFAGREAGLFGRVKGTDSKYAAIKNLTLDNAGVTNTKYASYACVAAVAADVQYVTFENVHITNVNFDSSTEGQYTGALVGHGVAVKIKNCSVSGSMAASVTAQHAGLIGYFSVGEVSDCQVSLKVNGLHMSSFGGIVANMAYDGTTVIRNCYVNLDMVKTDGPMNVGGVVAIINGNGNKHVRIENCYVTGSFDSYFKDKVNTTYGDDDSRSGLGGIAGAGWGADIVNCYVDAQIPGGQYVGANCMGDNGTNEVWNISNCSWNGGADSYEYWGYQNADKKKEDTIYGTVSKEKCSFGAGLSYKDFVAIVASL